jgi:hypothetical protein
VANGKLSRAHVGLALASALVVLLASGVAISRISEEDGESPVATGPSSTSSSGPALGAEGSATGGGPAGATGTGGAAEQAAPASGESRSWASPVTNGVTRAARKATGSAGASGPGASGSGASGSGVAAGATDGATASGSAPPGGSVAQDGSGASGGGPQNGGQDSPPAPSQTPPEPLAAASVSAGEGAQGAVVGLALGNSSPVDADVTIGTDPVVGDHPPSEGTGVDFGGRLLQAPPSLSTLT